MRVMKSGALTPAPPSTATTSSGVASGAPVPQYAAKIAPTAASACPSSAAASVARSSRRASMLPDWGWRWNGTLYMPTHRIRSTPRYLPLGLQVMLVGTLPTLSIS